MDLLDASGGICGNNQRSSGSNNLAECLSDWLSAEAEKMTAIQIERRQPVFQECAELGHAG